MKRIIFLSMLFLLNSCGKEESACSKNSEKTTELNNQLQEDIKQEKAEKAELELRNQTLLKAIEQEKAEKAELELKHQTLLKAVEREKELQRRRDGEIDG